MLTEDNKRLFDQVSESKSVKNLNMRPMSAYTRGSSKSRMSNLPDISKIQLSIIANDIYRNRQNITEAHQSEGANLRDNLSSSELQALFRKAGMPIEIGVLKAVLKELGFNWNGKACSLMSLFQKCQEFNKPPPNTRTV